VRDVRQVELSSCIGAIIREEADRRGVGQAADALDQGLGGIVAEFLLALSSSVGIAA